MSYQRRLIFNLRMRGLSELEIAEALHEVRAHAATTGTPVEAEFGTSEEYAKQFPKKKRRRTLGSTIVTVGGILAIAYILLTLLLMFFRIDVREYIGPITLWPALVVLLASTLAGFLTDYLQPAQSSRAAR